MSAVLAVFAVLSVPAELAVFTVLAVLAVLAVSATLAVMAALAVSVSLLVSPVADRSVFVSLLDVNNSMNQRSGTKTMASPERQRPW